MNPSPRHVAFFGHARKFRAKTPSTQNAVFIAIVQHTRPSLK